MDERIPKETGAWRAVTSDGTAFFESRGEALEFVIGREFATDKKGSVSRVHKWPKSPGVWKDGMLVAAERWCLMRGDPSARARKARALLRNLNRSGRG